MRQVADTGAGIGADELRARRVGLNNVEQRLHLHYDGAANLTIEEVAGGGTNVEIRFDLNRAQPRQLYQTTAIAANDSEPALL